MTPYYLILLVFNLNGQYKTAVMNYPSYQACTEAKHLFGALKPPLNAKYRHEIGLCLRGESDEEFEATVNAILREKK